MPDYKALTQTRPKKSLGQNFLRDEHHARRIVAAAEIQPDEIAIEIGPGVGALTQHLVQVARKVLAIELDASLIPELEEALKPSEGFRALTIIRADAMTVDFAVLLQEQGEPADAPVRFVANLPYYITSAAIRKILESGLNVGSIVLTIQKEVAERIVAKPGEMSLLALSVQFYGAPSYLHTIPPGAFYPPPKVHSAVIKIVPHAGPRPIDADTLFHVAKAGFAMPRKQLRNNLAAGLALSKPQVDALLLDCEVDPTRRPETLSVSEWTALAKAWAAMGKTPDP
jgi:16S rRNA (adenine1518-N6/adenine1519-N6)-dimethyltransferase